MDVDRLQRVRYETCAASNNPLRYQGVKWDFENYHLPLDRLGHRAVHGAGVALGLEVSCTVGQPGLTVQPGVAFDTQGRLIALSGGGKARVLNPVTGVIEPKDVPVMLDTSPF